LFETVARRRRQDLWESILAERPPPDHRGYDAFIRSLSNESDRAVPVIFMAFIDNEIEAMLRQELNPAVTGGADRLLQPDGLFGSFGARVNLCQAVRWISDETASDLHLLRRIRNEFAHDPYAGFERGSVPGWISSLQCVTAVVNQAKEDPRGLYQEHDGEMAWMLGGKHPVRRTRRLDFIMAASITLHRAVVALYLSPAGIRSGFGPGAFMVPEEQPEEFAEFGSAVKALFVAAIQAEDARA